MDGEGGPPQAKGGELLDQFQKALACRFPQRVELVVPKSIAELGGLIPGALLFGLDDPRSNQKPARRLEYVLIEVCFLADPVHVHHVGEAVSLGRDPPRKEHGGDSPAPVLAVGIEGRVTIFEQPLEWKRRLSFDKIPYRARQGEPAL